MEEMCGAAVVHGNTAYFSEGHNVYSYTLSQDKWAKDKWTVLERCEYEHFSMAVVNNRVTTIGGERGDTATNILLSLLRSSSEMKWEKVLPSMPTPRITSAAITTPSHLIVAGGEKTRGLLLPGVALSVVELLDTNTLQWSSVSSAPEALQCPNMTLCNGQLYLSKHSRIFFSCFVKELIKSSKPASATGVSSKPASATGVSVWTQLANIPLPYWASLTTLRGQVLAIGGSDRYIYMDGTPTGAIHRYNRATNSWSVIGGMPTPRAKPLVAVLPSHELIVVGGYDCAVVEIASSTF